MTIRRLAKLSGFSKSTVSSALRGEPRVTEHTRRQILRCAEQADYQLNPVTSRLMSAIARRKHMATTPLMVLSFWDEPRAWDTRPEVGRCYMGICQRASQLGYRVDTLCVKAKGIPLPKLRSILETRAIEGVILLAPANSAAIREIDLGSYARAVWGRQTLTGLPAVDLNEDACLHTVFGKLRDSGFERVGVAQESDTGPTPLRAIADQYGMHCSQWIRKEDCLSGFDRWIRNFSPDALLVPDCDMARSIVTAGYVVPGDFALVVSSRPPHEAAFAGIDPCYEAQGSCLVDLVDDQLLRAKAPAPAASETRLLTGCWFDGHSLPARKNLPVHAPVGA